MFYKMFYKIDVIYKFSVDYLVVVTECLGNIYSITLIHTPSKCL